MYQKRCPGRAATCCLAFTALAVGTGFASQAYPPPPNPITVAPLGLAEVPTEPQMQIRDAGVDGGKFLCFLLRGPGITQLLRTDSSGNAKERISLGDRPAPVTELLTSSDGQFALMRHNFELESYSTDGSVNQLGKVGTQSLGRTFVNGRLYEVTASEVFASDHPLANRLSIPDPPLQWPLAAFSLGRTTLGVIEMGEAVLRTVNMQTGQWKKYQLRAPEIQDAGRPPRTPDGVSPPIFSVATDASTSNIYVAISPFNVNEGATILKFSEQGDLVQRLRCSLPRSSAFQTERIKDGHFSLTKIAFMQRRLFLISFPQKHFFFYALPNSVGGGK